MTLATQGDSLGTDLPIGARHYRAWVGSPDVYDILSATQFNLLTFLGLREHHYLLDIGCGSLRAGRLFIPYLLQGRYFGIEPEQWVIEEGIKNHVGEDLARIKQPTFSNDSNFTLTTFNQQFDFILAQSIFSHAAESQISRCLSEAKEVMNTTAVFVANFAEGEHNYKGSEWIYPGLVTYTFDYLSRLAEEQGLTCSRMEWPRLNTLTWVTITHPEHAKNLPGLGMMDVARLPFLENELRLCRERLSAVENHPYVRLGLKIRRFMNRL
ncbi:MAG: methyltransferase [Anaerolineae bacterium]